MSKETRATVKESQAAGCSISFRGWGVEKDWKALGGGSYREMMSGTPWDGDRLTDSSDLQAGAVNTEGEGEAEHHWFQARVCRLPLCACQARSIVDVQVTVDVYTS